MIYLLEQMGNTFDNECKLSKYEKNKNKGIHYCDFMCFAFSLNICNRKNNHLVIQSLWT
jgi:hypothetical protein